MAAPDTWVFIRGLAREAGHWGDLLQKFQSKFSNGKIECIDLPGAGQKYRETSPSSIEAIADQTEREFLATTSKAPVGIVAISMGSLVALEWLRLHPDRIAALVLINPSIRLLSPPFHRLRPGAWLKILGILLSPTERREARAVSLVSNLPDRYKDFARFWKDIQRVRPVRRDTALAQLWAAGTYSKAPQKFERSLVLASEHDRLVNPSCSKVMSEALDATLMIHPTAGHDLSLDDPDWVVETISNWIRAETKLSQP